MADDFEYGYQTVTVPESAGTGKRLLQSLTITLTKPRDGGAGFEFVIRSFDGLPVNEDYDSPYYHPYEGYTECYVQLAAGMNFPIGDKIVVTFDPSIKVMHRGWDVTQDAHIDYNLGWPY